MSVHRHFNIDGVVTAHACVITYMETGTLLAYDDANAPPEPEGALHFGCTLCYEFLSIILCSRRYSIMAYLRKAGIRKSW